MINHIFLHALEVSALVFDKEHNSDCSFQAVLETAGCSLLRLADMTE